MSAGLGLVGRVSITGGASLVGSGTITGTGENEVFGEITILGDLADQLRPGVSGVMVEPAFEVRVNGVPIPATAFTAGTFGYSASMDSPSASCSFALLIVDGEGHFSNPALFHGPPMGKAPIEVDGLYRTAGGLRKVPLIRNGIMQGPTRSGSPESGYTEAWSVVDSSARLAGQTVTLYLKPGHGLSYGAVIQRLFAPLGVTRFRLDPSGTMYKAADFIGADPFRSADLLAEVKGRALFFDHEDYLVNPFIGSPYGKPIKWRWDERDIILTEAPSSQGPTDVLTEVTLTGSEQILRESTDDSTETKTIPLLIEEDHVTLSAAWKQNPDCTLSATGIAIAVPRRMPVSLTLTTVKTRRGVEIFQQSVGYSFILPETTRYNYASGGVRECRSGVYLLADADPIGGGPEPAYIVSTEFWANTERQTAQNYYYEPGFPEGPFAAPGNPQAPYSDHFRSSTPLQRGFRAGSESETWGWYIVRAALKHKGIGMGSTPWDEIDPITSVQTLGNGEAVTGTTQRFMRLSRSVETVKATDDGYLDTVTIYTYGFAITPGVEWQFASGEISDSQFELFKLLKIERTSYVRLTTASHLIVKQLTDLVGDSHVANPTEISIGIGAPPAADKLQDDAPNRDDYETDEEFEQARVARDFDVRPFKAIVNSPALEAIHPARKDEQASDYIENPEQGAFLAEWMIEKSAAMPHTFAISINCDVRRGDIAYLKFQPLGWDFPVQVHSVDHTWNPAMNDTNAVNYTRITAMKYPERI